MPIARVGWLLGSYPETSFWEFSIRFPNAGNYSFTVNLANNDGGGVQSDNNWPFTVNPTVSGISPAQGLVGTAVNVTITGTGFAPGATIQAGTSITVSNVSVSSSTTITATFTIENSADAGGNWNVTVTSGGQTSTSKTFLVQIPTSLNVISVNLIANGANGGCKSTDFGIHVDVKYQVQDQNTHAIQSAAMIPQESVNGSGWGDILTTFYTNSDGTYDDAPLGTCASKSFNMNVTQAVRMDVKGGYYNVRTNNFNVIGSSAGHGSISNGSDIKKTR